MAKDAKVLFQTKGNGIIQFAGQPEPAVAINADTMARLHFLGKRVAQLVRDHATESEEFRERVQNLHFALAMLSMSLTDTAARHDLSLSGKHRISGSEDFIHLDESDHSKEG